MHANITYNMYTQILPPVHNMSNVYLSYSAVVVQRWEELSCKFQTLKAALQWLERPSFPSFERFSVPRLLSESAWDSVAIIGKASTNIRMLVQANRRALEEEVHMHCKMLAREEAADMQVNQERMQEAFYRNTMPLMLAPEVFISYNWGATRLGDEDA